MGGYGNPLTGSGWSSTPMGQTNPINAPLPPGVGSGSLNSPDQSSGVGVQWGNPGGYKNPLGDRETSRNAVLNNIIAGQQKNALAPQFAKLMGQYGGSAGDFFSQLMNLGSPFYKQAQSSAFNTGVQNQNNAIGNARQQLNSQGYGFGPSGAAAAMLGGQNQMGAQTMSENYLQNLFNNENLMTQGAQGLSGLAQLFNPTQLLGGIATGAPIGNPTGAQQFGDVMGSLSGLFQGAGTAYAGH